MILVQCHIDQLSAESMKVSVVIPRLYGSLGLRFALWGEPNQHLVALRGPAKCASTDSIASRPWGSSSIETPLEATSLLHLPVTAEPVGRPLIPSKPSFAAASRVSQLGRTRPLDLVSSLNSLNVLRDPRTPPNWSEKLCGSKV